MGYVFMSSISVRRPGSNGFLSSPGQGRTGKAQGSGFKFKAPGRVSGRPRGGGSDPGEEVRRPGQDIGNQIFSKALDMIDDQKYKEALGLLKNLKSEYPEESFEAMVIAYNIAESHFFSKSLNTARDAYVEFIRKYPKSPFLENAKAAIDFIDSFKKFKGMYVSPDEIKR